MNNEPTELSSEELRIELGLPPSPPKATTPEMLITQWRQRAKRIYYDAESAEGVEKRGLESVALGYAVRAYELEEVLGIKGDLNTSQADGVTVGLGGSLDKSSNVMILRKRLGLAEAIAKIGVALRLCHNCVTTDLVDVEPDETSWRIDHSKEIAMLDELEAFILNTHISP